MNGASASTVVARISTRPNKQRKTASGTSQRLPESLRHSPCSEIRDRSAGAPEHDQPAPYPATLLDHATSSFSRSGRRTSALGHQRRPCHERIDPAAPERRIPLERTIDDRFSGHIERRVEQHRDAAATPVRLEQRVQSRRHVALERLEPGRAVDVRDRGELRPPLGPHREDARHEPSQPRAARRQLEIAVGRLDRRNRRKRPELLAVLDVAIEPVAHLGRVRRGQNTAMAERARPELGGAVHPADDTAGDQLVRDPLDQRTLVELFDVLAILARRPRQLTRVHRRPPERMVGHVPIGVARGKCGRHRAPHRARNRHHQEQAGRRRARSPIRPGSVHWRRR